MNNNAADLALELSDSYDLQLPFEAEMKLKNQLRQLQSTPTITIQITMETIFIFAAYNQESVTGFGTESEAEQYCEYLNSGKEINLYQVFAANPEQSDADINLCEELIAIADQDTLPDGTPF